MALVEFKRFWPSEIFQGDLSLPSLLDKITDLRTYRVNTLYPAIKPVKMSVKKSSKQKNTRHHISTAPGIAKKKSAKAKLRNQDLRSKLDEVTGLGGAANLFAPPPNKTQQKKKEQQQKAETEKTVEDDMM